MKIEGNQFPKLAKAPIVLAILEIKFKTSEEKTNSNLQPLEVIFKKNFPIHNTISTAEVEFKPELEKTPISLKSTSLSGHSFISEDKKNEFFISTDTFTFKQHGEYDTWAKFKEKALSAWAKCLAVIEPKTTERLSLRYINSIEISATKNAALAQEIFLNTFIASYGSLQKTPISEYSLRYTHPLNENKIMVNFAQELRQGSGDKFPFIIDIDVLYISSEKLNDSSIQNKFDELRKIKNEYFFDNLTDSTYIQIK